MFANAAFLANFCSALPLVTTSCCLAAPLTVI
jgi:hypothetical protein